MNCEGLRGQLTAYLDGELPDDRGSAVRGHLRGCDACRTIAADEAALRDGLRSLPPLDPPASLWAGVAARLASEEVADAKRPAWRLWVARWAARLTPRAPQLALGGAVLAAAITLIVIKQRDNASQVATNPPPDATNVVIAPSKPPEPVRPPAAEEADDVTAELAALPTRQTQDYAAAAKELLELAQEARAQWSDDRKRELDGHLVVLQHDVDGAKNERAKQKAYRALIRYLQRAVVRDEVALASVGGAP